MKILCYGTGAIGSLLIHFLCKAGNDVTVVARSTYEDFNKNGIIIRHCIQRKATVDFPKIVRKAPENIHYDIVFSVMQGQQQNTLLTDFSGLDADLIVLVGNNMEGDMHEQYIISHSSKEKRVLFAFQNSAGHRENGITICGRAPSTDFIIGGLHQKALPKDKQQISQALNCKGLKLTWCNNMYAYYLCHIAEIMPYCYLCYRMDYNLKAATKQDIKEVMTASCEAFDFIKSIGVDVMPVKEDDFYRPGPKYTAMLLLYRIMCKTFLGELMVSDHCKNGVREMKYLEEHFNILRNESNAAPMPTWDSMRSQFPAWDKLME